MASYFDDRYYDSPRRPAGSVAAYVWAFLFLLLLGAVLAWRFWPFSAAAGPKAPVALRVVAPRGPLADIEKSTINLYERVAPSVVNVTTSAVQRDASTRNLYRIDKGMGSGFVWDDEGHIVTNDHVVRGGNQFRIRFGDGSEYPAQLVGSVPEMDLAVLRVLRVPGEKLKPVQIGESHNLKVGQFAFAIGNPFGLDQSLATGVVSALNREIESRGGRTIGGVIQTTAPINPGNSGGPLLDSYGRVIGVNTAILSPSGAWAGIGFAIPVDDVNRVVTGIINRGRQ